MRMSSRIHLRHLRYPRFKFRLEEKVKQMSMIHLGCFLKGDSVAAKSVREFFNIAKRLRETILERVIRMEDLHTMEVVT